MTDMRIIIKHQSELALAYAKNGAYPSAARVLSSLAKIVRAHAKRVGDLQL